MPNYKYTAMNELGRTIRGNLNADNDIDLENRLKEIDLDLIDYKELMQKKAGMGAKVKQRDLIMMCLHLEQLNRAGVSAYDALMDVRDSTESLKLRDIVADMCERIKSGAPLSEAMAAHNRVFGSVFVGLVKAGEANGDLTESFMHMTNHMKWSSELKRRVRKAISYPLMLLVVMTLVIIVLMVAVVPKLVDFMTSQGFDLPLHTRALIATSEFVQSHWWVLLITPILLFVTFKIMYRFIPGVAYWLDGMVMRMPIIGNAARKINLSRFAHFFGVLFRSGIDILDSLEAARDVVTNRVLKQSISTVIRSVTEGNSLTESLKISGEFPNLVVRMFKVGEDSGNMNEALENVAYFYNREVDDAVDGIVGSIQPIMTAAMGAIIFWIIAAVFGPLYQSFQDMNF
jgi:type IV pilus assembly protein PilC